MQIPAHHVRVKGPHKYMVRAPLPVCEVTLILRTLPSFAKPMNYRMWAFM